MLVKRLALLVWAAALCMWLYLLHGLPAWPSRPPQLSSLPQPYQLSRLPAGDAAALIDLRGFHFLINNFPCGQPLPAPGTESASTSNQQSPSSESSGSGWGGGGAGSTGPLLLALVHSAPDNLEKRAAIRSTWGGVTGAHFRVRFLLGDVGGGARQARLDAENRRHGDLVQGSFRDAYHNMSYKHAMGLKWAAYHCPGARFVLKVDDDYFLARKFPPWGARRLILCHVSPCRRVLRSRRSKWYVSLREYPHRYYPAFCLGISAILYSPNVVFLLYQQAQAGEYLWLDDVHFTGTLAARANLTHTALGALELTKAQVAAIMAGGPPPHFLFGAPGMSPDAIRGLWKVVSGAH